MPASGGGAPPRIEPKSLGDYLEVMSKAAFQGGMSWRVVEAKWPGTREAFHNFDIASVAGMSETDIDRLANDSRLIKNRRKIAGVVANARKLIELDDRHGSFRDYLRSHGGFDGTVRALRKDFKFLGEFGSYYFLYVVGEDVPSHEEWMAAHSGGARR